MSERTVVVEKGDTLYDLAARHLGHSGRWTEIWNLNRESIEKAQKQPANALGKKQGPDWIFPGTTLILPPPQDKFTRIKTQARRR